jgi:hypothetical protein
MISSNNNYTTASNPGASLEQRITPSIERFVQLERRIFQRLRVALPGIVTAFAPGPPAKVSVQIATNEPVTANIPVSGVFNVRSQMIQIPLLVDVPLLVPCGGGYEITFPVQIGDEVLVIFSDTQIDQWLGNGGLNNYPNTTRRHSLADGIAILGLRSKPRGISSWSANSLQIRNDAGSVVVDVGANGVTVTAANVTINATNANVTASGNATITGGTVTIGSNTHIDGKTFLLHTHSGVQPGSGNTGPVL